MLFFGSEPPIIIALVVTAILAFAYHEFAHAIVADRLGDNTPRSYGRISLNPIVHLDLFGIIMLLLTGFGWATTPVNPYNFRGNRRVSHALVAVAGPIANLIMAAIFAFPLRFQLVNIYSEGQLLPSASQFCTIGMTINLLLFVFNLIPIPPLDGFTILVGLVPPEMAYRLEPIRQYGQVILLVAIFLLPRLGFPLIDMLISPIMLWFAGLLLGGGLTLNF